MPKAKTIFFTDFSDPRFFQARFGNAVRSTALLAESKNANGGKSRGWFHDAPM